jgi:ABC-type dipeptide/oligopeptide/nickel transport system permease subunit
MRALESTAVAGANRSSNYFGWGAALVCSVFFALIFFAAPHLTPYRVTELAGEPLQPPSRVHLLGTNMVGQDIASQMVSGARASLFVALFAGCGTLFLGGLVGMISGLAGGNTDMTLMRLVDLVLVIPKLPLLILVGTYAGQDLTTVAIVIALISWPSSARMVRSQVLSLRRRTHLKAAMGFGAGVLYILRRHVIPEVGLILVAGLVAAAGRAVMLEAGLAFLGLGDPSRASWGSIMRDALNFQGLFFTPAWAWWLMPPLISIILLLLGLTFFGVAIEKRINPRLIRHQATNGQHS